MFPFPVFVSFKLLCQREVKCYVPRAVSRIQKLRFRNLGMFCRGGASERVVLGGPADVSPYVCVDNVVRLADGGNSDSGGVVGDYALW